MLTFASKVAEIGNIPMATKSLVKTLGDSEIKLLRIFKAVVESGGVSAAETELNVGRSTISKHLSDLELRLDLKLCHRGPSGFCVTTAGQRVLEAAEHLLDSVSEFRGRVNDIKEKLAGTVRIALFDQCVSNPHARLPQAIHEFNRQAPNVDIELALEPPTVIETKLIGGQLDIGIIAHHRPSPSLEYAPLYGEKMYLYCGVHHPFFNMNQELITLDSIREAGYAGIGVNSPNLKMGQRMGLRRNARVQNEHALSLLVLSGRYVGFLPSHMAEDFVRRGEMKAILPETYGYQSEFSAAIRRSPEPSRSTRLFLETLISAHG